MFLSYWALAAHDPVIDERMKDAFDRSRQALQPVIQAVIDSEPVRFCLVTAEGLVSVVMAITQGCAMQSLLSKHHVDAEQIL